MAMTINGNGTIIGLSVGGLPNGVITQSDLAPNVTGNSPLFMAYQGAIQYLGTVVVRVTINTVEVDTHGCFDTVNNRFLPTVAGYYQINGNVTHGGAGGTTLIYKNDIEHRRGNVGSVNGGLISTIVYLNGTTDYVELWVLPNTSVGTWHGANQTYFHGFLIRAV